MRKHALYPSLAVQTIRKNKRLYLPYLLTGIFFAAMFYILLFLNGNDGIAKMPGSAYVESLLVLGSIVIGIFAAVILMYTNSFLIKRRKKELGLYNILGMEKLHIGRIMLWESFFLYLLTAILGVGMGILLSKLLLLLLCSLLRFPVPFGFEVSPSGIVTTLLVFGVIFLLNLLSNLRQVGKAKPVELLSATASGEKEPKVHWPLTVLGLLSLGGGYAIALTVKSPLSALLLFFVAVLLVILGTYCLFISGSIAVLKLLKKNKKFYYRTNHFITVSGMLYRMKRNAAGLASICILATMVLVTVSTTVSLYAGLDETIGTYYPHDILLNYTDIGPDSISLVKTQILEEAQAQGVTVTEITSKDFLNFFARQNGAIFSRQDQYDSNDSGLYIIYAITDAEYNALTGASVQLSPGQALYKLEQCAQRSLPADIVVVGVPLHLTKTDVYPMQGEVAAFVAQQVLLVVNRSDMTALSGTAESPDGQSFVKTVVGVDLAESDRKQEAFFHVLVDKLVEAHQNESTGITYKTMHMECRSESSLEIIGMYGGFFFLGLFLGALFLAATVLIIYYKQITEGYEDADRYTIMRQVGLGDREVRSSIRSQVLTVFFLPLIAAGIHVAFAFKMIVKLLAVFSLQNVGLFALCCLLTLLVFVAGYTAIYLLTSRAYYRIVDGRNA